MCSKQSFFINTVTDAVLSKEKQVVKNEKRQGIDNRPYGHTHYVIDKNLYPEGHPYNWTVIGELEDLQNATLERVQILGDDCAVSRGDDFLVALLAIAAFSRFLFNLA